MLRRFSVGDKVGRLTVQGFQTMGGKLRITCVCECGKEKLVRSSNLGRQTNSCGCLKAESIKDRMGKPIEDLAVRHVLNACKRHTPTTDLTFSEVKRLILSKCYYCEGASSQVGTTWQRPIPDGRYVRRVGLDRVDSSIGYYLGNVVACCSVCNRIKREHSPEELLPRLEVFIRNLRQLVEGRKWQT